MKCNINQVLVGSKAALVPYASFHVPKYHEWMLSEELRELTASEPLSLEEEYEMQQKWQVDEDKLTFIILSREGVDLPTDCAITPSDPRLSQCPMVGDVNIFINGPLECLRTSLNREAADDVGEEDEGHAEVEIMIAEPSYRRRGYAREALQLMLHYATGHPFSSSQTISSPLLISPTRLLTRISETNTPSISLFESLGFKLTKRIPVFSEVEMRWSPEGSI